jgi:glycosyltransferase involved in cell wall biosynthesis
MQQIKVLIFSSVVPNARGSGGELVLHRHLELSPGINYRLVRWQRFPFRLKLIGKLKQLGFKSFSRSWECLFPVFPPRKLVETFIERFQPDILLTVAHGWWHIAARSVAREFKLPLVSFFQDWWPDFPDIPIVFRSRVEREFRRTCSDSAVAICVSDGMRRELGWPLNGLVIHPIPSLTRSQRWRLDFTPPLRLVYFGNLQEYGPSVESALHALDGSNQVRLEVFGPNPLWTDGAENYFRSSGLYHGFVAWDEFLKSLEQSQAVLIVMSFAPGLRRRMITSFPSKMVDAMQLGLPVVIWGPEYCSAVQWARQGEHALCVTDPKPAALRNALETLAMSPGEQERLARASREAARTDFNPKTIQALFMEALRNALAKDQH